MTEKEKLSLVIVRLITIFEPDFYGIKEVIK